MLQPSPKYLAVKANMAATDAEKMSDEELLAQMSCVSYFPTL